MQNNTRDYLLGHQEPELERLMQQAQAFGDISDHLLQLAGLKHGMRVLDLGCGPGDVSFLAARIVGAQGSVVGVDASDEAIALAQRRARYLGIDNVEFIAGDVLQLEAADPALARVGGARFDALIGRLVLMYLPEPANALRRLARLLRPDALVTFQEFDIELAGTLPRCELFEKTVAMVKAAFRHRKLDLRFGRSLSQIFRAAGLPAPEMRMEGRVESGANALSCDAIAQVTRTLLPVMIQGEIATAEEIDIDTLATRLRDEVIERDASLAYVPLIAAWSRVAAP
jgi:ubiquinone/menaquinone biosynthesis C-methylase UbiE